MIHLITVNAVGMVTTDPGGSQLAQHVEQLVPVRGVRGSMAPRALVGLLALVSGAGVVSAGPLVWNAPSGCPDAADVRARIERRLGASVDHAVHGIEITVVRDRGAFVATIDARALTVANDVRTLRSERCEGLADAVAVIVARLASEARDRVPDSMLISIPEVPPAARVAALEDATHDDAELGLVNRGSPKPMADDDTTRKWGGGGHLRGLSGAGALPSLNLGIELAGHVRRFDRFIEVGAGLWIPQSAHLQVGAPARVDVSLQVITVRGGWSPRDLPLRAWLTAEVGRIQGIGIAVDDPRAGSSRWSALGGGFNVAWPMSPIARLVGAVELMIPIERTVFMLADGRDLYRPSSAAARCSLGIEIGWK